MKELKCTSVSGATKADEQVADSTPTTSSPMNSMSRHFYVGAQTFNKAGRASPEYERWRAGPEDHAAAKKYQEYHQAHPASTQQKSIDCPSQRTKSSVELKMGYPRTPNQVPKSRRRCPGRHAEDQQIMGHPPKKGAKKEQAAGTPQRSSRQSRKTWLGSHGYFVANVLVRKFPKGGIHQSRKTWHGRHEHPSVERCK